MYCTQCGTELPDVAQFCSNCGAGTVNQAEQDYRNTTPDTKQVSTTQKRMEIRDAKQKQDRKAPPKIAPLYIFLAIIGIALILVLLHPWHTGQERPEDFQGSAPTSQTVDPEMKSFIIRGLHQGKTPHQVASAIEIKYGHRRTDV